MDTKLVAAAIIETFVRGFAITKSRTHPYVFEQVNGLWVMRDAPRKNAANNRKQEWIAYGIPAATVHQTVTTKSSGNRFLGVFVDSHEEINATRDSFKALGYRLLSTEFLFTHRLAKIQIRKSPATIVRMQTTEQSLQYAQEARIQPMPDVLPADAIWWHYLAYVKNQIVGWVSSIKTETGSHWVSNLVVREAHRRQGIASALLAKMLRDDRARGAQSSVLLASHTGALVYPKLGYQQTGVLLIFAPKKA